MKSVGLFFFLILFSLSVEAQTTTVQVIDAKTQNPVAFTKISDGENVVVTDIDGKSKLHIQPQKNYTFHFFDYRDKIVKGSKLVQDSVVYLFPESKTQNFSEVLIRPGENPALRIIRNVQKNQKKNDPLRNDDFAYDSYSKFYATGEVPDSINQDTITDTLMLDALAFMKRQYIFLIETGAHRAFSPPNYDKTTITSYNVSGIKAPIFATLLNQYQSFSFYDNNFNLGGTEYINPIAPGTEHRYWFILQDTLFHKNRSDTTYIISFRPQKGKNFEGLSGYLYINTNGWAIQRVIASPYSRKDDNASFGVTITQEYKVTNHKKWFPQKISTEIKFKNASLNGVINMIARGAVYVRNVTFNQLEDKHKGFNPVKVSVAPKALADSAELVKLRGNTATGKEANTYHVIDSVAKANNYDRLFFFAKVLSTGKVAIGKLSFPLKRIAGYNQQEGLRLGLGVETNNRLSQIFQVGGYFAYGFHDDKWKWGGDMQFTINKERLFRLKLHYSDDLHERGGTSFYEDNTSLFRNQTFANYFINRLDRARYAGINLSGLIRQNVKLQVFGNYKRFFFTDDYQFLPLFSKNGAVDKFDIAEVGIVFNWNIHERVMMLGDQRVSLGTKWPKIAIKAVRGFKGIMLAQYDYYRFNLRLEQDFKIRGAGKLSLYSNSGMTVGNVPLTLMQVSKGTGSFGRGNFALSAINTFQTMLPAEFFSDRFTALFAKFSFLPIKNKTNWTEPQFSLFSSAGVGKMSNVSDHRNYDFKTLEKGYYESGLTIDNLLKLGISGFGFGLFYRYGPYAFDRTGDNFFYKLTLKVNLLNN